MNETDIKLYPWQKDCLAQWEKYKRRGIVNAVTGAGKTRLAISAIQSTLLEYPDLRIKIVVPTLLLTRQWASVLASSGIDRKSIGFFHGARKDTPFLPYMIYVVNSARYHISQHILQDFSNGYTVLLIADECHHYGSTENRKIFDFLPVMDPEKNTLFSIGLSATPFSTQARSALEYGLGPEIFYYGVTQAVSENVISPFHLFQISLTFSPDEQTDYQKLSEQMSAVYRKLVAAYPFLKNLNGEAFFTTAQNLVSEEKSDSNALAARYLTLSYLRKELSILAASRITCALKLISLLQDDARILVFCERISQANALYHQLENISPNCSGLYHSQMNENARKTTLDNFRSHHTRILISCRCLDEGMDVPDASTAIVLSSTALERQRLQRLGRILRNTEEKEIAVLYYLYLKDSSDDCIYLPFRDKLSVSNLQYLPLENDFIHPVYEDAAADMLSDLKAYNHFSKEILNEARKCLLEGIVRSDWMLPPKNYRQHQMDAATRHEKNYWICMERLRDYIIATSNTAMTPQLYI